MNRTETTLFWVSGDTGIFGYEFGFFSARIQALLEDIDNVGAEATRLNLHLTCGSITPDNPKHSRYTYTTTIYRNRLYQLSSDFSTFIEVKEIDEEYLKSLGYSNSAEILMWALGWDKSQYRPVSEFNESVNTMCRLKASATAPIIQNGRVIYPTWEVDHIKVEFLVDDIVVCIGTSDNHDPNDVTKYYWTITDLHENDVHTKYVLGCYLEHLRAEFGKGLKYAPNYPKLQFAIKLLSDQLNKLQEANDSE